MCPVSTGGEGGGGCVYTAHHMRLHAARIAPPRPRLPVLRPPRSPSSRPPAEPPCCPARLVTQTIKNDQKKYLNRHSQTIKRNILILAECRFCKKAVRGEGRGVSD